MKKLFALIGVVALLGMTLVGTLNLWLSRPINNEEPWLDDQKIEDNTIAEDSENINLGLTTTLPEELPVPEDEDLKLILKPEITINVPFYVQSPFAKWDELHNEACEEASLIMADSWIKTEALNGQDLDQEILDSVAWQEEEWGGHFDLNVQEVIELANKYFGIQKIYYTSLSSINDIKKELNKGNLVIIPTAGRLLKNPYYRSPGPAYHMLVVIGYNEKEVITNDPGTRNGKGFSYPNNVFFNAIHNWPFSIEEFKFLSDDEKAEEVELQGEKIMIVVERET